MRYLITIAELITMGVWGTSLGNGPPAPVGVDFIFMITSMPTTTLDLIASESGLREAANTNGSEADGADERGGDDEAEGRSIHA